jgi:excisionase family DNA binding protein
MPAILIPIPDVAKRLGGVHQKTVRNMITRGELRAVKVGSRVMVPETEVDAYIERNALAS